jgi:hypothetical protein
LFFDEGGSATGVEKQISPLRFAPVEMTAFFFGLRAWLKEVVESRVRAKREQKQEQEQSKSKSRSSAFGEG